MKLLLTLFLITISGFSRSFSQAVNTDSLRSIIKTDSVYSKVDIIAQYPGGEDYRKKFIRDQLKGDVPLNKGCPLGTYTVIIKCIVDISGVFIKITPETSHGYGMEEEVIRVIRKFPVWIPAIKNEIKVKSFVSIPITFKVFR